MNVCSVNEPVDLIPGYYNCLNKNPILHEVMP